MLFSFFSLFPFCVLYFSEPWWKMKREETATINLNTHYVNAFNNNLIRFLKINKQHFTSLHFTQFSIWCTFLSQTSLGLDKASSVINLAYFDRCEEAPKHEIKKMQNAFVIYNSDSGTCKVYCTYTSHPAKVSLSTKNCIAQRENLALESRRLI